ncbi:Mariner Mos1 transposase [Eumeta japonica]|uniref:Mariner Mos1 transposase n=1 Tax=Eumeta variegata TaxID=151549 RepID=A0A4C1SDP8_EUMVA|nr:Mariner Mos1 transposase [Eumeta japonica]
MTVDLREIRPCTETIEDNINDVQRIIETDERVTYQQIRTSLCIGTNKLYNILHEYLTVRKLCARWIPYNLNEVQKLRLVNWCREIIQLFAGGDSDPVYDMITSDEIWVYCYKPETKKRSAQWMF